MKTDLNSAFSKQQKDTAAYTAGYFALVHFPLPLDSIRMSDNWFGVEIFDLRVNGGEFWTLDFKPDIVKACWDKMTDAWIGFGVKVLE